MEPWLCHFDWKHRALLGIAGGTSSSGSMGIAAAAAAGGGGANSCGPSGGVNSPTQKLSMNLTTKDIINFNVTSTLVELYQMVKANWTEDYYNMHQEALNNMELARGTFFRDSYK